MDIHSGLTPAWTVKPKDKFAASDLRFYRSYVECLLILYWMQMTPIAEHDRGYQGRTLAHLEDQRSSQADMSGDSRTCHRW